jgi:energy-coupling factor transport system permease protein
VWAIAASLTVQIAPNPLYVGLVVLICSLLVGLHRTDRVLSRAFPIMLGLGVLFACIRVGLTVLTTHGSGGTVLMTLPEATLPRLLGGFTVGGPIEAPVLAQAVADAVPVIGIMAAFGAFNSVVAHHELLRSVPQAFHEPALVVTVAITLVPATMRAVHDTREADRARAGRTRRRGRIRRTLLPVLETGMERAVSLAESMDSRGFARRRATTTEHVASWITLLGLITVAGGFLALVAREQLPAAILGGAGALLILGAVVVASRAGEVTRYRPRHLSVRDLAVMAASIGAPLALAAAAALGDPTLTWVTSPLHAPSVDVVPLLAIALLLAPVLVPTAATDGGVRRGERRRDASGAVVG